MMTFLYPYKYLCVLITQCGNTQVSMLGIFYRKVYFSETKLSPVIIFILQIDFHCLIVNLNLEFALAQNSEFSLSQDQD